MDELDALRKKKLAELQNQAREDQAKNEQMAEMEQQIKTVLAQILTPEARSRLTTVKMAKPEYGAQVELLLIQLAQSGQVKSKITDDQLKALLAKISKPKKEFKIRRI
jgi:programmed cell death protein 5